VTQFGKELNVQCFDFALRIVKLAQFLSGKKGESVLSKQVLRSGTGIGANVRESVFAQSTADFVSKLSIALKEASETQYWLEILHASGYVTDKQFESLKSDADRIVGMLVSTVKSNKRKLNRA